MTTARCPSREPRSARTSAATKSNAHFGAYLDAHDQLIAINQAPFAASLSGGRGAVTGLLPWTCGALLAAGLLTLLGLRPRPVEFR